MKGRAKYITGTIICLLLTVCAAVIAMSATGGRDALAVELILAYFCILMAWGVYRGLRHLLYRPAPCPAPTLQGLTYNPLPVPLGKVAIDFFNPLKMEFLTMGEIFIVVSLLTYSCLVNQKAMTYFWIFFILLVLLKVILLTQTLRLAAKKNEYGILVNDELCEYVYKDGTRKLIYADYATKVTKEDIGAADATSEAIITPVRLRVNVCGTYDDYVSNSSNFTQEQRHILAVNHYVRSVEYYSSHLDFFTAGPGIVYKDALDGLLAIGAKGYADILLAAVEKFDGINHPVYDLEKRTEIIEGSGIDFYDEDDAYFELNESGDKIEDLMMAYIRRYPDKFIFNA